MLTSDQIAEVNRARTALGKRPITSQMARQNVTLVNWLAFWTNYDVPGDPPNPTPIDPVIEDASQEITVPGGDPNAPTGASVTGLTGGGGGNTNAGSGGAGGDANSSDAKDDDKTGEDTTDAKKGKKK